MCVHGFFGFFWHLYSVVTWCGCVCGGNINPPQPRSCVLTLAMKDFVAVFVTYIEFVFVDVCDAVSVTQLPQAD